MEVSSRGRNAFLTALGILGALVVVAIAARGSTPAGEGGVSRPSDTLIDILLTLYIVALLLGAALFVYGLVLQRRSLRVSGGWLEGKWWHGLAGLLLVGATLLAVRQLSPRTLQEPSLEPFELPGTTGVTPTTEAADGTGTPYEPKFAWIPAAITLALLGVAVFGVWWAGRARGRARGELRSLLADEVAAAVDESLDDLRAEPDPRRAVIAAYARLERVLAAHGLPREASEAPLEYLSRMLTQLSVSPPAARTLTDLFERAKFSLHAVGPEMKEDAIGALELVRDDLAAARALAQQERAAALEAMRERAAS
jgi:hypothetical protein